MKVFKTLLPIIFFLCFTLQPAFAQNASGIYNTDFDEMTLQQNGDKVTGKYKFKNGRIDGTLNGNILTGRWHQDNGKGKLIFTFNDDFSSFTGKWDYDNAEPARKWNGSKTSGSNNEIISVLNIAGIYNTDFDEMTLQQNGDKVTGTYKFKNGRIKGSLKGYILTGWWSQDNGKGKLIFKFNNNLSGFIGKWDYDNAKPARKWNGTKQN